jgi:ABC-type branched-subunit amino acid transport system ATPase component
LEVAFRVSPRRMLWLLTFAGPLAAAALAVMIVAPWWPLAVTMLLVLIIGAGVLLTAATFLLLTLVDPRFRNAASVLLVTGVLFGGVAAAQLSGVVGQRFGIGWAILVPGFMLLGWSSLGPAQVTVDHDIDATIERQIEVAELTARRRLGQRLPLLVCKHIDFSYGQVQVLFDVSFSVADGEIVALLGTNGAGKTTLLRTISGVAAPSAGSVHYRGEDVTFAGADQRVAMGISQIPGGRAVFGALTVVDNLRAYGYTYGRKRSELNEAIDEAFAGLPKLYERRNQLAQTLSGGEQQMLGVAKAYIMKPRVLLIDELSLGLAPIIVSELLDMVRRINEQGTAVVLVEQSVNVALSLAKHAYFMEKGEIRFDGPTEELLQRPELLRSVFLRGATVGLMGADT